MKVSELLSKATPQPVTRAKNLGTIAWVDGYNVVRFRGRPDQYVFGPNIAEVERDKLLRSPFPDKLFTQTIKGKFQCYKVPRAA